MIFKKVAEKIGDRRGLGAVPLLLGIAAIGILVAVLNILLQRSGREEQALMTTITALVVVLMVVVQKISELFNMIKALFSL